MSRRNGSGFVTTYDFAIRKVLHVGVDEQGELPSGKSAAVPEPVPGALDR